ncbi:hypothetical protein CB1_056579095 [Camelus ferus]|nr:hypothetical protein CB1_056579095 [Camelus ferus]
MQQLLMTEGDRQSPGLLWKFSHVALTLRSRSARVVPWNAEGCLVLLSAAPQTPSLCTLLASAVRSADVITFVLKDLNVVKTQSAKTGIQKLPASARMVTSLSRETLPTVRVSQLTESACEKRIPGRRSKMVEDRKPSFGSGPVKSYRK